jgi:hypothetical protein
MEHWSEFDWGSHFPAMEVPDLLVAERAPVLPRASLDNERRRRDTVRPSFGCDVTPATGIGPTARRCAGVTGGCGVSASRIEVSARIPIR